VGGGDECDKVSFHLREGGEHIKAQRGGREQVKHFFVKNGDGGDPRKTGKKRSIRKEEHPGGSMTKSKGTIDHPMKQKRVGRMREERTWQSR